MLCSEFRRSFEILAPPEARSLVAPLDEVKAVQELVVNHLEMDKNLFKFGLSRIFFRAGRRKERARLKCFRFVFSFFFVFFPILNLRYEKSQSKCILISK